MKALIVEPDGPVAVRYGAFPDPELPAGWALVEVRNAGLNRNDALLIRDRRSLSRPHVIGSDGAGTVVAVGDGVDATWLSREVVVLPSLSWGSDSTPGEALDLLGFPTQGTFAELVAVPVENLYSKPSRLSWREAAALPLAGLTAWRAVVTQAQVGVGQRLLVTGASGGVSTFAVQIAVALGVDVFVTTSTEDKLRQALALGARGGVVRTEGWVEELGGGFDAVIDSAAADWTPLLQQLRRGGRLVSLGRTARSVAEVDPFELFWHQRSIIGTSLGSPSEFAAFLEHVEAASWTPVVDVAVPLAEGARAFELLERPHFGKVLLDVRRH